MGAFDDIASIIIPDPNDPQKAEAFRARWKWEPHEQVILRGAYTTADMEAVTNASLHSDLGTGGKKQSNVVLQSGTGRVKLMERMIIDWTFVRNGQKVPVTPHAIRQLPYNYQTPILEVCDDLASATMSEEELEDFLTSAGAPILDDLKPTNTHQTK